MKKEEDILKRAVASVKLTDHEQAAQQEHKKRLLALKKMDEAEAGGSSSSAPSTMISSKYKEDHIHHGHKCVWGSFYDAETHKWGYACCKSLDKNVTCPYYNPEDEP